MDEGSNNYIFKINVINNFAADGTGHKYIENLNYETIWFRKIKYQQ